MTFIDGSPMRYQNSESVNGKEGNVLYNDALNIFYLRLYGVRHMVKDHSDSERETCCHHMGYSFQLGARVLLYAPSHRQDNTYHGLCYTSRGALVGMRNGSTMKDRSDDPSHHERTLLPRSYISLPVNGKLYLKPFCKDNKGRKLSYCKGRALWQYFVESTVIYIYIYSLSLSQLLPQQYTHQQDPPWISHCNKNIRAHCTDHERTKYFI